MVMSKGLSVDSDMGLFWNLGDFTFYWGFGFGIWRRGFGFWGNERHRGRKRERISRFLWLKRGNTRANL